MVFGGVSNKFSSIKHAFITWSASSRSSGFWSCLNDSLGSSRWCTWPFKFRWCCASNRCSNPSSYQGWIGDRTPSRSGRSARRSCICHFLAYLVPYFGISVDTRSVWCSFDLLHNVLVVLDVLVSRSLLDQLGSEISIPKILPSRCAICCFEWTWGSEGPKSSWALVQTEVACSNRGGEKRLLHIPSVGFLFW